MSHSAPDRPACYWQIFFELYEALPRQGPGNRASAARALALCGPLPAASRIGDFGCGGGGQTLHLASLLPASTIAAIDTHAPLVTRLQTAVVARGLTPRVHAQVGDMAQPPFAPGTFDLIWSEGALYQIGVANGLTRWRPLLRPHGCIVFTEAVWLRSNPPAEVQAMWDAEYPQLADVPANLAIIARAGYCTLGHFALPPEAWWDDFYTPMEARIVELRAKYAGQPEPETTLNLLQREVDLHRRYGDWYGYEFFIVRPE
jgi:SAM-dependent methyltransferase